MGSSRVFPEPVIMLSTQQQQASGGRMAGAPVGQPCEVAPVVGPLLHGLNPLPAAEGGSLQGETVARSANDGVAIHRDVPSWRQRETWGSSADESGLFLGTPVSSGVQQVFSAPAGLPGGAGAT